MVKLFSLYVSNFRILRCEKSGCNRACKAKNEDCDEIRIGKMLVIECSCRADHFGQKEQVEFHG